MQDAPLSQETPLATIKTQPRHEPSRMIRILGNPSSNVKDIPHRSNIPDIPRICIEFRSRKESHRIPVIPGSLRPRLNDGAALAIDLPLLLQTVKSHPGTRMNLPGSRGRGWDEDGTLPCAPPASGGTPLGDLGAPWGSTSRNSLTGRRVLIICWMVVGCSGVKHKAWGPR